MSGAYLVWCPENGQERDDGRRFTASDAGDAASRWAKWYDAWGADYLIVGGSAAVVMVESPDGSVEQFTVTGESMPAYRAYPAKGDAGQEGNHP